MPTKSKRPPLSAKEQDALLAVLVLAAEGTCTCDSNSTDPADHVHDCPVWDDRHAFRTCLKILDRDPAPEEAERE